VITNHEPEEVARVFEASGLIRPTRDIPLIAQMFANANIAKPAQRKQVFISCLYLCRRFVPLTFTGINKTKMKKFKEYFPHILLAIYIVEFCLLAINPFDRSVWWAENLPVLIPVFLLMATFKIFRFSNLSYLLIAIFFMFHTVGGHYTFERTPFDFFNNLLSRLQFDFLFPDDRNNFDRVGHFLVGILAYPIAELFLRKKWVSNRTTAIFLGILALGFWGALYEVIEMYYAISEGGESGASFLGSQGDIWDAQKDMFLDILGAVCVFIFFGSGLKK
jgi:putative membrane protein